jgi:hypothetical protein
LYIIKKNFIDKPDLFTGLPYLWLITGLSLVYLWLMYESICLSYAVRPDERKMEIFNLYAGFGVPGIAPESYEISSKIN